MTIGADQVARVFEARTGRLVAAVDHGGDITSAALTPNGMRLVTTGRNRGPRIWTLGGGGELLRELPAAPAW